MRALTASARRGDHRRRVGVVPRERWGRRHAGHMTLPWPVNAGTGRCSNMGSPMRSADGVPCRSTPGRRGRLDVVEAAQTSAATGQE